MTAAMLGLIESDVFALVMLGVILSSFGVVGSLLWSMKRRVAQRDAYVDALLEELSDKNADVIPATRVEEQSPKPWEKPADWWQK